MDEKGLQRKVLSFIFNDDAFLALRNNPHPYHGGDFWFVVTGGVENGESYKNAVKREIKEETGLNSNKIIPLNWGSIYEWNNITCNERNYLTYVDKGEIVLNEEHIEYEWLALDKFIKKIKWGNDRRLLKTVLDKAINGKQYFDIMTFKDYRERNDTCLSLV